MASLGVDEAAPPRPALQEILQNFHTVHADIFTRHSHFPARPGRGICMKYMRSGECAGGRGCRFDHPMDRIGDNGHVTIAHSMIKLLENLSSLCTAVSQEVVARDALAAFISDIVAVLDKYFDDLTADYGPGSLLYGDSVLRLHGAFNTYRKSCLPKSRRRRAAGATAKFGQDKKADVSAALDSEFEEQCKIHLQCLKYLNTRWVDGENLLSSVLRSTWSAPSSKEVLTALEGEMQTVAGLAVDQQGVGHRRKEAIQSFLLDIANEVVDALIVEHSLPQRLMGTCILKPFGSSANGLGSSASDLDLCLGYNESLEIDPAMVLDGVASLLADRSLALCREDGGDESGDDMSSIVVKEVVVATRVPVLKLFDTHADLEVDICVNNFLALKNTALLRRYCLLQPRFRRLVLAVKHWAKARGCADPRNATLTSYAWTLLVANFMINHEEHSLPPSSEVDVSLSAEQSGEGLLAGAGAGGWKQGSAETSAAQLFMEFFSFYGICCSDALGFSPFHHILSVRRGSLAAGKRLTKLSSLYTTTAPPAPPPAAQNVVEFSTQSGEDSVVLKMEMPQMGMRDLGCDTSMPQSEQLERPVNPRATALQPLPRAKESSTAPSDSPPIVTSSLPTWRFCIEDPYEEHDLGRVIFSRTGQMHMMSEMRRVLLLFQHFTAADVTSTGSFWATVCAPNTDVPQAMKMCGVCGKTGHFSRDCSLEQLCNICGQPGHFARDCDRLKCRKCNKVGHYARDCQEVVRKVVCTICRKAGHDADTCRKSRKGGGKLYDPKEKVQHSDSTTASERSELDGSHKTRRGKTSKKAKGALNDLKMARQLPEASSFNQSESPQQEKPVKLKANKKGRIVEVVRETEAERQNKHIVKPGGQSGRDKSRSRSDKGSRGDGKKAAEGGPWP